MWGGALPQGTVQDLNARIERVLRAAGDLRRLLNAGGSADDIASAQRRVKLLLRDLDQGRQAALDAARGRQMEWGKAAGEPWAVSMGCSAAQ